MIDFLQVHKQFGAQVILEDASFRIHAGERVGVVGPNGAGKSTVFGLISGEVEPDAGRVQLPRRTRLGYVHQQLNPHAVGDTLLDYVSRAIPSLAMIHAEIQGLEKEVADFPTPGKERLLRRIGELQHAFEDLGGYEIRARAQAALGGLGFRPGEYDRPFRALSGGWQMRAELARALLARPDILLLDEPSNYLDLPAVEWLQRFLRGFAGTMLLVSHDRYLLRTLTERVLEIQGGRATAYPGGFDHYERERRARHEQQAAAHHHYLRRREHLEQFIRRFRAKATKAAQVQSRVKMLEKLEAVPPPPRAPDLSHLRIPDPPHSGTQVLQLAGAGLTYDGQRWIFRGVDLAIARGEKVAVTGYNGMGKTTLLRVMAGRLPLTEGLCRLGHQVVTGYQAQDFAETMPPDRSVFDVIRDAHPTVGLTAARTLLGSFGFGGEAVDKPCGVLSGGEKIRLAFARIFVRPPNFLLLDEPTTHLDLQGREALEEALRRYRGTACLVSHDVTFVRNTATRVLALTAGALASYPGGYDYYLEKTAGQDAPAAVELGRRPAAADRAGPIPSKGRGARIARARQREAEKTLRQLERDMDRLRSERDGLHACLAAPGPRQDYAELNIRLAEINTRLAAAEEQWLAEAEALDGA